MTAGAPGRWLLLAAVLLLHGCGGAPVAPVQDLSARPHSRSHSGYHVVRRGETLYSISFTYGYDYREVARWNGIHSPYRIYPGQKLRMRPPTHTARRAPRHTVKPRSKPRHRTRNVHRAPSHSRAITAWRWPTSGPVLHAYSATDPGKKGIDIGGKNGQPVLASASGEVVYSGSGLIRFGKLIIIKHNQTYFSAYAHNRKLLVKEGMKVRAGQEIAEMGSTGATRTMLHFEIRRNGKPVDPLRYLPRR